MNSRQEVIKFTAIMSFAGILGKVLSFPLGIINAKYLGPSLLGVLALLNLIKQYTGYMQFGLLQNLLRDVPIAYGKGDYHEASTLKNVIFTDYFILVGISSALLWILFFAGITFKGILNLPILLILTLVIIGNRISSFLRTYLKTEGNFGAIAKLDFLLQIFVPTVNIPAIILFKFEGALFSLLLTEVACVVYALFNVKELHFKIRIDLQKTFRIFRVGFVLFFNKIADSIFWSIDLMIVGAMLTTADVGYYSFALGSLGIVEPFTSIILMTIYRKIMIDRGKSGDTLKSNFKKYTEHIYVIYLLLSYIILGCGFAVYNLTVNVIIKKYDVSLYPIIILSFGYMFFVARTFVSFYLDVSKKLYRRSLIVMFALVVNAILDYIFIKMGFGIIGVAFSCSFCFILIATSLIWIVFVEVYNSKKYTIMFLLKIFIISIVLTCILFVFYKYDFISYMNNKELIYRILFGLFDLSIKVVLYCAVCLGLFLSLFNKFNIKNELYIIAVNFKQLLLRKSV
jgi:O-antigen/teichoic acid export membrane protein